MSSLHRLFESTRGPTKIEITNMETGEKFSYDAIILQHEVQLSPQSQQIHMFGKGIVEECIGSRNKEVTLKFIELTKKPEPKFKGLDAQLREFMEKEEEMLWTSPQWLQC